MTDPATNALATQMIYGDEEMQREVDERIRSIAREEIIILFNDPSFANRFITNNAYMFEQIAKQAFKNAVSSINVY